MKGLWRVDNGVKRDQLEGWRVGGGRVMEVKVFNWVDEGLVEGGYWRY